MTDHIKATDVGVGLRYETGHLDDALQVTEYPGEPVQQNITDRQGTSYDLFSAHSFTETWVKTNLMVSTGLLLFRRRTTTSPPAGFTGMTSMSATRPMPPAASATTD